MLSVKKYIIIAATCFFSLLMLQITLPYLGLKYDVGFLLTKQSVLHNTAWRYSFYVHITTSIFVLLFGGIQFVNQQRTRLHRFLGKWYVVIILAAAAPSGFIMGLYANGGLWAKAAFVTAAVLWWWFTWQAYVHIRAGRVIQHRIMMAYSYALTLSAITLRTYALILPFFVHLRGKEMYVLIAWLGWVPNLLIAVWLTRKSRLKAA